MARIKKIIVVARKNIDVLAKVTRSSETTVYNALAYRSDSEKAQEIRRLALSSYGGIETKRPVLNK